MEEAEKKSLENWEGIDADFNLSQLEHLEGDAVSIQCVNSSEFVIGKQTNFNGPVTIINCASTCSSETPKVGQDTRENPQKEEDDEEKVVIRGQVLSKKAETVIQQMGERSESNKGEGCGKRKKSKKSDNGCQYLFKWLAKDLLKIPVGVWILVIGLLAGLALILTLTYSKSDVKVKNKEEGGSTSKKGVHRIYTKADWNGSPSTSSVEMKLPVAYVIISHSGTPQCTRFQECAEFVRNVQAFHMSDDYADIGYNFIVDPEGNIYEGRGWSKRNVIGGFVNNRSIDINIIGDYSRDSDPTSEQMESVKYLIQYGIENGKISKNYSLISANATYPTLSPGKNVYKIIKNWPNFDSDPLSHVKDYE